MRKNFYRSGLFLCILALCVCGCGGGGGSPADPMGTGTIRFISESKTIIDTTTVAPNGTITLRAWVTNTRTDGTVVPVVNEKVSFAIVNSGNGGSLVASSDRTGSNGEVTALFTAGNSMYSDQVRATTSVGATATIYINKVSGSPDPYIKEMKASNKEVVAGQTSVITVNVVDGTGSAVKNVYVRFRLTVNNSGAVFADAYADANFYAYTDLGGNATVVYQAGNGNPYAIVYDSVVAETENGSSMAVEIKRTAGTAPTTEALSVTLAAAPTSVAAGITSIITATVTGTDKAGADVTLTIPVNNSGAAFIVNGVSQLTANIKTGGTGIAEAIYRAGNASSGTAIQDTIQALLANGSNAAIIVTRTAATTPSTYTTVAIEASSTSVDAGEVSIVTATVTTITDGTSKAAPGIPVIFTLPVNSSGATLKAPSGTGVTVTADTDAAGKAQAIYQPGTTQVTVQDTVRAAVGAAASAVAITVNGSSTTGYSITLTADPATLSTNTSNSVITANVKNNAGAVISGVPVYFEGLSGRVSPQMAITDNSGNAVTVFTGDGRSSGGTDVVTARVMSGAFTDAVIITYPAPPGP